MIDLENLIKNLSEASGVSAKEKTPKDIVKQELSKMQIEVKEDRVGNLIGFEKQKRNIGKIMIATHIDEIGLMVTNFDENLLRFTTVGGIDKKILLGQEVTVYGSKPLKGVIGSIPPHFQPKEKQKEPFTIDDLFIDVGLSEKELKRTVKVGDFISFSKKCVKLLNNRYSGKSFDNRVGVAALLYTFQEMKHFKHNWDIYGVFTVQEEITGLGASSATYSISPDVGIAIDATFGKQSDFPPDYSVEIDKGPIIAVGPNIHTGLRKYIVQVAKEYEIPFQLEAKPGLTGTDATEIQVSRLGVPTLLISIPLLYMHTPIETISITDIKRTGRLIAIFLSKLTYELLKGDKYAA